MIAYGSETYPAESHVALVLGDVAGPDVVPVRVHSHCLSGDVFGATLCDCREVIEGSLRAIAEAGRGVLVYLHNGTPGFTIENTSLTPSLRLHHGARPRTGDHSDDRSQRTLREVGLGARFSQT